MSTDGTGRQSPLGHLRGASGGGSRLEGGAVLIFERPFLGYLNLRGDPLPDTFGLRCDFPGSNVLFQFTYYERTGQAKMKAFSDIGLPVTFRDLDRMSETGAERMARFAAEERHKAEQEAKRKANAVRDARRREVADGKKRNDVASRELSACLRSGNYAGHMKRAGSSRQQDDLFPASRSLATEKQALYAETARFGYDDAAAVARLKKRLDELVARVRELLRECESRVAGYLAAKAEGERIDAERTRYADVMASRYDEAMNEVWALMQSMPRNALKDLRIWRSLDKRRTELRRRMSRQNIQVRRGVEVVGEAEHEVLRAEYEEIIAGIVSLRAELVELQ